MYTEKKDILTKAIAKEEQILVMGLVDTETVEHARVLHDTYPTATAALGRTMSGTILLSAMLKEGQRTAIQIVGDGPIQEVFAEADSRSRVRAYIRKPHIHRELIAGKLDVGGAIGKGFLHVTKDLGLKESYHGNVPLKSGEIAEDLAYYLSISEQIPAAVSLGVYVDKDNSAKASGGFMIQMLPNVGEEITAFLEKRLGGLRPVTSMILDGMGPEEIMLEAAGIPLEILERRQISYYCPCSRERVIDALVSLGQQEIREMAAKEESLSIECRFCKTKYSVSQGELLSLLDGMVRPNE